MENMIINFVSRDLLGKDGAVVTADDEIVLDGTVDSLGVTRLVAFIEKEFSVTVPPQDVTIENFRSIATMAQYVRGRQVAESDA